MKSVLQWKSVTVLLIDTETLELLTNQTQRNQTQPNLNKRNQKQN